MRAIRPAWVLCLLLPLQMARADVVASDAPSWKQYDFLARKLRVGRKVEAWRGLSATLQLDSDASGAAVPGVTGRFRAEQAFTLRRGLQGVIQVAADRDIATSRWLEHHVEAELRFQASPIRGMAIKLQPHAWTSGDLRHLRAAVQSSVALKIAGNISLAARLESGYDRLQGQWFHSPTVGIQVDSEEFNWPLPKL